MVLRQAVVADAGLLEHPRATIEAWKQRDRWDDAPSIWRNIVSIRDAEMGGCDLFDIEELEDEYAPDEFANLFMCDFVDDSQSAFRFNDMIACGCDSLVEWADFNPEAARPYGNRSIWAGYDPQESENGDNAALVIAAPPLVEGGKFRIFERHQLRGLDFEQQAEFIKAVLSRYSCTYLGIDAKGVGAGVYQLLAKPGAMPGCAVAKIEYSLELKAQMIMKAQNVIRRGRLAFDSGLPAPSARHRTTAAPSSSSAICWPPASNRRRGCRARCSPGWCRTIW